MKTISRNVLLALAFGVAFQALQSHGQYTAIGWPQSPNPYSSFDNIKVDFADLSNGCFSGTVFYSPSTGESYHFYLTHDGGQSWVQKGSEGMGNYYNSYFVSSINSGLSFTGYSNFMSEKLWRVADSGDTWYNFYEPLNLEVPEKIFKYNDQYQFLLAKSYICDSFPCQILYRIDGEERTEIYRTRRDTIIIKIAEFLTLDKGFLITFDPVDSSYSVRKTINGGVEFIECFRTDSLTVYDIDFFNDSTGMISCSGGYLFKTMDNGDTWNPVASGITYNIHVLDFIDNDIGYLGGSGYAFYRTKDQGMTWSQLPHPPLENVIRLNMLEDGLGYIQCDYEGFCYLYSDTTSQVDEMAEPPFDIFPNPVSETLTLRFHGTKSETFRVSLFNVAGIPALPTETISGTAIIDVGPLPSGIYILVIAGIKSQWVEKIIRL